MSRLRFSTRCTRSFESDVTLRHRCSSTWCAPATWGARAGAVSTTTLRNAPLEQGKSFSHPHVPCTGGERICSVESYGGWKKTGDQAACFGHGVRRIGGGTAALRRGNT